MLHSGPSMYCVVYATACASRGGGWRHTALLQSNNFSISNTCYLTRHTICQAHELLRQLTQPILSSEQLCSHLHFHLVCLRGRLIRSCMPLAIGQLLRDRWYGCCELDTACVNGIASMTSMPCSHSRSLSESAIAHS